MSNIEIFNDTHLNIKTCRMCNLCGRELTSGQEQGIRFRYKGNNGVVVIMCDDCLRELQARLETYFFDEQAKWLKEGAVDK